MTYIIQCINEQLGHLNVPQDLIKYVIAPKIFDWRKARKEHQDKFGNVVFEMNVKFHHFTHEDVINETAMIQSYYREAPKPYKVKAYRCWKKAYIWGYRSQFWSKNPRIVDWARRPYQQLLHSIVNWKCHVKLRKLKKNKFIIPTIKGLKELSL